jgi:hypothetical protein
LRQQRGLFLSLSRLPRPRQETFVNDTTRSDDNRNTNEINRLKCPTCGGLCLPEVYDIHTRKCAAGIPFSGTEPYQWGHTCATGFVRDSRFGSGQVIPGTNRNKSRANRRLVNWGGAK